MLRRVLYVTLALSLCLSAAPAALADDPDPVGFCDMFETTTLDPAWSWVNPTGDCAYSIEAVPHTLQITSPAWPHILTESAPRLLQPVTGDFVIQTQVILPESGIAGPSAGLLVYQDSHNYIGATVGGWPRTLLAESRVSGVYSSWDAGAYAYNSVQLKISRTGDRFVLQYSPDNVTWTTITTVDYGAQHEVQVGLYVTDWAGGGCRALFDEFIVKGCPRVVGGEQPTDPRSLTARAYPPVVAPGGRFPVKWIAQGGTAVSETYLMWDTESHEYHRDYPNRTATQAGGMDVYSEHIRVPEDAEKIFFQPYARMDNETIYGPYEYTASTLYALNVGADAYGLDDNGLFWHPDRESDWSPVWYEFWGGERLVTSNDIAGTDEDWLFQSQRAGIERMTAWLGSDLHEIDLEIGFHLAEIGAPTGERVFDIVIEPGTPHETVISHVNVADLAGGLDSAVVISETLKVEIVPEIDEHLEIVFEGDEPIINGITLRALGSVPVYRVERLVGAGYDDTYTDPSGTHTTADNVLLGGQSQYHGGFRFPALNVPQGAVIRQAAINLTASANASMSTTLDVYAHAIDSSPSFAQQAVVSSRPRTDTKVDWEIPGDNWQTGAQISSPNLAPVLQEIVDRPGWQQANALSLLLIAGQGHSGAPRKVYSYEGSFGQRAGLTVYYSNVEDIPTPTPTATATPTATNTPTSAPNLPPTSPAFLPLVMK